MPLSRVDFQKFAETRIAEAGLLLANGMWDGAYYLAGYAVECALKACIMAYVERTGVIFEDEKYSEKCSTHDIEALMVLAGLKNYWDAEISANPQFELNWETTTFWTEASRYARKAQPDARALYDAITDLTRGVLTWTRRRW